MKRNLMAIVLCASALTFGACGKGTSEVEKQAPGDSINTGTDSTTNPAVVATDTSTTSVTVTDTTATSDISGTGATNHTGDVVNPTTLGTAASETMGTSGTTATR